MNQPIDVRYMSLNRFRIEKGSLDMHSLFYITKGEIEFSFGGSRERAGENTLLSFPSALYFERKILSHAEFYYFRYISPEVRVFPAGKTVVENTGRMLATAKMLLKLAKTDAPNALKNALLADIFTQVEAEAFLSSETQDGIVALMHAYFEKHLKEKVTLPILAELTHLSPTGLIHHVKKQTGQTPIAYLAQMRLSKAETLLAQTNDPIAAIAAACGFDCPYYFSNAFKNAYGLSPRDYRQKYGV